MPKEIYPSAYLCDCGFVCDFFENTVREIKKASNKRRQYLIADDGMHEVVFCEGGMVDVICPKLSKESD